MNSKNIIFTLLAMFVLQIQTSIAATYTVGTAGTYATLKAAFDAVNAGSITGSITLQVISNTTETASASLNASGSGSASYTDITIYPTGSGYTISGNLNTALINLNGADNVIIDGRVNATGSTKDLIISNTNTGASASAITFIESATTNTVKYCTIKGVSTSSTMGVILFSTATAGNGNDGNTIDYCDIRDGASTPMIGIYSAGTATRENSGNTISNNNIYNCYNTNYGYGINIFSNSTTWTISGNSIYQTSARSGDNNMVGISINTGNGHTISDNYIGGGAAQCGGSTTTYNYSTSSFDNRIGYIGIYLNVGTSTASSVQNNVVKNVTVNGSHGDSRPGDAFAGILVVDGAVNVGTVTGNTIGSRTATSSINITGGPGEYSQSDIFGIAISGTGIVNVSNNSIGGISISATSSDHSVFQGIDCASYTGGNASIENNLIGSISTTNSIVGSSSGPGITLIGINTCPTVTNNTISNITNNSTSSYFGFIPQVIGIQSYVGTNNFSNNTIRKLSNVYSGTSSGSSATIIGISQTSTTAGQTISGNTIDSLSNTHASAAVHVYGIYYSGPTGGTNTVKSNFIRHLTSSSSSVSATIRGISIDAGVSTYSNNIILLGKGLTTGYIIHGMYENGAASNNNNLYFNTVYLEGAPSNGTYTSALYSHASTNTRNIRNNIFNNARSRSGGTSKHYAAYFNYAVNTNLTLNYNNYYASGTGGVFGYYNATDQTTLPLVTSNDANSAIYEPGFTNEGGTTEADYYPSKPLSAASGTGITIDYLGYPRGNPFAGALEAYVWQGNTSTDYNTASNWAPNTVPPSESIISFHQNPDNPCVLDQNRTLTSIVNAQATDQFVHNGFELTLLDRLIFSGGATLKANDHADSKLILSGSSSQSMRATDFENQEINHLEINNSNDVLLEGDITLLKQLTFTDGKLNAGSDIVIVGDDAVVIGAGSSNYIIGACRKIGDEAFTFPTGSSSAYAPISISAPSFITDHFTAEYFNTAPHPTYDTGEVVVGIHHLSGCEYWTLDRTNGSSNVDVTLSWDTRSCGVSSLTDLTVARWDGSEWTDEGNASTTGNTTAGTITSNTVSSFSPFTLASKSSANPLPIELLSFDGDCEKNKVKLTWQSASEHNNEYFTIERSLDTEIWEIVGKKNGAGNSNEIRNYDLLDSKPLDKAYYRLKQTDINGDFEYSKPIFVKCDQERALQPLIYPNPSSGLLSIQNAVVGQKLALINQLGQVLHQDILKASQMDLDFGYLPKGIYFIQISDELRSFQKKVIIE